MANTELINSEFPTREPFNKGNKGASGKSPRESNEEL